MLFIGIDIASVKHDIAIVSNDGEVLSESFTIDNNIGGFKKLHMEIQSHTESLDVCIGMEETGIYHQNIAKFLFECGYTVFCTNANLTHNFIKSRSLRLTKTDKVDALHISNYVMLNYRNLNPYTPKVYNTNELKSLSRLRFNKLTNLSKSKSELKRLLMVAFPEFVTNFNPLSKWALHLLATYKSVDKISRIHKSTLIDIIKTKSDRDANADLLKSISKNTIGHSNKAIELEIQSCIQDINHFQSQIDDIDFELKDLMQQYKHITSIPGVGIVTGALIIGEIGDVKRFKHKSQLLAYAGCDPTIYQSGNYRSNNARLSKRGSKYLRSALFTSARVACVGNCKDNKFRDKYLLKRAQNKHHYSAVFHAAKNMLHSIHSMLITGEAFDYSK